MIDANQQATGKLVVATFNSGKIREITEFLSRLEIEILGLEDFGAVRVVDETGMTFAENARLKATGYAAQTQILTLADDSGLEVDGLGGRPGIFSARYGGESATDDERNRKLLDELSQVPTSQRTARFVCAMALVDGNGQIMCETTGRCEGRIGMVSVGSHGFGYDPIFIPDGYDKTFGELADEVKKSISHRARAFAGIAEYLENASFPWRDL